MNQVIGGLLIVAALGCADAQTAPEQSGSAAPDTVVAEVGGRKITMKELDDRWQTTDPGERARVTQLVYQNRRNVLEQMMGEVLIEQAAKSAGMELEAYRKQEIARRLKPVNEEDVQQFFEENKDRAQGRTIEQLGPSIRAYLTTNRDQQARAQLIDDLKQKAPASRILLEPPRITVAISADDPAIGPPSAPVTIVEFSDYQ
jgi:SurA-like protein